ncbi:hypothetical protein EH220_07195, partial [bacterium]
RHIFDEGAESLIVGAGQHGLLELSDEAAGFFLSQECVVRIMTTPEAIAAWNQAAGKTIAMFHVTC